MAGASCVIKQAGSERGKKLQAQRQETTTEAVPYCRHKTIIQGINGGVLFIRPCAATELGMQELLSDTPKLRFSHGTAEQDFFAW